MKSSQNQLNNLKDKWVVFNPYVPLSGEEWMETEFPEYSVSNLGRVRNTVKGNLLYGKLTKIGYQQVCLKSAGVLNFRYVHHLVLNAFRGSRPEGKETRHLNGIRSDNRLENLAWGTRQENMKDKIRHALIRLFNSMST